MFSALRQLANRIKESPEFERLAKMGRRDFFDRRHTVYPDSAIEVTVLAEQGVRLEVRRHRALQVQNIFVLGDPLRAGYGYHS